MNLIYDFETLSQNAFNGAVINIAALQFDPARFIDSPYEFEELVEECQFIKFDVHEQVMKYGRKVEQSTIDWWKQQSKEAQRQLTPSPVDQSIDVLYDFMVRDLDYENMKAVWTRGNSFDPVLLDSILIATNKPKFKNWWAIRDTRSFLDGLLYGSNIKNNFIPDGLDVVLHDPRYDISLDVYRMQTVIRELNG
jgi:hypothetical protein